AHGIHQDVLTNFSSDLNSIAGYYASNEGTQHAIVATVDGALTEVYWRSGQGVHQDTLATFPAGIIDVGAYFNPDEGTQHAIVAAVDGTLTEVYWRPGRGAHNDARTSFKRTIGGRSGRYVAAAGTV